MSHEDQALIAELRSRGLHADADEFEAALLAERKAATPKLSALDFNTALAKLLQRLKKDAGADRVAQNYRGTGSQEFRRQLWVNFRGGAVIDLWLEHNRIGLGGVVKRGPAGRAPIHLPSAVSYSGKTPDQVYEEVARILREWAMP